MQNLGAFEAAPFAFAPTNADGKRISRNISAQTREECEAKLEVLIVEMKAEIKAEKERKKQVASA